MMGIDTIELHACEMGIGAVDWRLSRVEDEAGRVLGYVTSSVAVRP